MLKLRFLQNAKFNGGENLGVYSIHKYGKFELELKFIIGL
jgi:hypothetical protein